jgi:hypothetical protein
MPFTLYTDETMQRLAGLEARTFAVMHGSSFAGDAGEHLKISPW